MAEELKEALSVEAELVPQYDGQGNLTIIKDGQVMFSSAQSGRFPEDGEVIALLEGLVSPPSES